ncbi:hypothetical protein F5B20DRAFT_542160 [Whalleya microplaca]|nr:hypothetical protein F5B20DRAFT_542160 [Whalleya microplaca]
MMQIASCSVLDELAKYGIKDTKSFCELYDQVDVQAHREQYGCLPADEDCWYATSERSYQKKPHT